VPSARQAICLKHLVLPKLPQIAQGIVPHSVSDLQGRSEAQQAQKDTSAESHQLGT
jgi:hypothetical protein